MKFISRYQEFMRKRNGADNLYYFLLNIVFLLFFINIFLNSNILFSVQFTIFLITMFRFYSKNKYKRRIENGNFLKLRDKFLNIFKKKNPDYIFKKCHKCGTILRLPLPNKRGIKHTRCPKCHKRMRVICFRKQKIELIKNGKRYKR